MSEEKHEVAPENAKKMADWIDHRGGVAIWRSVNLSNPGASWSTPALTEDGKPYPKPTWEADSKPERIITDPNELVVITRKEVKRFHVALRRGSQGFMIKLTDGSSRKLRAALEKAGKESSYEFDYMNQEAVITVPDKTVPLTE